MEHFGLNFEIFPQYWLEATARTPAHSVVHSSSAGNAARVHGTLSFSIVFTPVLRALACIVGHVDLYDIIGTSFCTDVRRILSRDVL